MECLSHPLALRRGRTARFILSGDMQCRHAITFRPRRQCILRKWGAGEGQRLVASLATTWARGIWSRRFGWKQGSHLVKRDEWAGRLTAPYPRLCLSAYQVKFGALEEVNDYRLYKRRMEILLYRIQWALLDSLYKHIFIYYIAQPRFGPAIVLSRSRGGM